MEIIEYERERAAHARRRIRHELTQQMNTTYRRFNARLVGTGRGLLVWLFIAAAILVSLSLKR